MFPSGYSLPSTLLGFLVLAIALIVLWVVVSIPVYISGRLIVGRDKASLGSAMRATLGGAVAYVLVLYLGAFLLGRLLGPVGVALSFLLAVIAWLGVYRAAFETGWLKAIGIVAVGWLVLVLIDAVLLVLFGVAVPKFYPF